MIKIKILFTIITYVLISFKLVAAINIEQLRIGDVILLPQRCYSCSIVASETSSAFTHVGIVIYAEGDVVLVAEALETVRVVAASEFIGRLKKKSTAKVFRSYEFDQIYHDDIVKFSTMARDLRRDFYATYLGKAYDRDYLWDNYTISNEELYYCSEFVVKLINSFLFNVITPVPMTFRKNWAYWYSYFNGNVPEGKPGISPGYFATSKLFFDATNKNHSESK